MSTFSQKYFILTLGLVPERLISGDPGLKVCCFCSLPSYLLLRVIFVLSLLYLRVKAQKNFVCSSLHVLGQEHAFNIWLNPGFNLTIFEELHPG